MPNVVVFPGGTLEIADCLPAWLKMFHDFSVPEQQFAELRPNQAKRPFIYDAQHSVHKSSAEDSTTPSSSALPSSSQIDRCVCLLQLPDNNHDLITIY